MKTTIATVLIVVIALAMTFPANTSAAGSGKCVFDHSVTATVEPIEVSYETSNLQIRPGEEVKLTYTIVNSSSEKNFYVFCNVDVPQNCLVGAMFMDTGADYRLGEEFPIPLLGERELEITVSPNLDFEGDLPIRVIFYRTYSTEPKG